MAKGHDNTGEIFGWILITVGGMGIINGKSAYIGFAIIIFGLFLIVSHNVEKNRPDD